MQRHKLERAPKHLILTSDFDAALISETHLEEAKLTTAVDQARKSAWAGTGRTAISTAINGTSARVLGLLDYFLVHHILGVRSMVNMDFDSVVARQLIGPSTNGETMTWKHLATVNFLPCLTRGFGTLGGSKTQMCFNWKAAPCRDGQEAARNAWLPLGYALETWSDAAAQYWATAERQGRSLLTGGLATFHLRPVLGETRMPMACVILAGGSNTELRSWKAFG